MVPPALGGEPRQAVAAAGEVFTGPTPVAAVGATDQHSQVQLFMEGPFDKVITFVVVDDLGDDLPIPRRAPTCPPSWPTSRATRWASCCAPSTRRPSAAFAQMGRMNCTLRFPRLDAETLGEP